MAETFCTDTCICNILHMRIGQEMFAKGLVNLRVLQNDSGLLSGAQVISAKPCLFNPFYQDAILL